MKKGPIGNSKYFTWEEAACNDGTPVPAELYRNVENLAMVMLQVRSWFGQPVTPNSWYRTPEYNSNVGGAEHSMHVKGLAVDFIVKGWQAPVVYAVMERLIAQNRIPDGGLGKYANWTHYDMGTPGRRWVG